MDKILGRSFLFLALAIGSIMFLSIEAKANGFFFEQGECEYLDGSAKRVCLLHCEFLECDEAENLNLGPILSRFHKRTCNRLLDRYEEETGVAGPPCFCNEACGLKYDECFEGCEDADDPNCCRIQCGNARSSCNADCCIQSGEIEYQMCLDDCNGDATCEASCFMSGCGAVFTSCPVIIIE
jgi:hypothetical protein